MTDPLDRMTTRELQYRALDLAKEQRFPRVGVAGATAEGKDGWLMTVHERPALARSLCERLEQRQRWKSQQSAAVRLFDPYTNPDDRAIAAGRGQEI